VKNGKPLTVWTARPTPQAATSTLGSGVTINGTFNPGSNTVTLSGSWLKTGTFTASTSTVRLNGSNQTLSGSTIFYNLTKTVTATGTLTLASHNHPKPSAMPLRCKVQRGNLFILRSSQLARNWKIDPQGTRTVPYLDVKDSNNINASAIDCSNNCMNSGNNTNWSFNA